MKKLTIMASVALLVMTACNKKEKAFDATGTFEATEVTISAKATGELKSFDVTEGQTIDVLARHRYEEGRLSRQTAIRLMEQQRLYNVLGTEEFRDIEFFSKPLQLYDDDIVLLMTDGVSHALKWVDIEKVLERGGTPEEMARHIIEAVDGSTAEDKDNASVLLYMN